MDTEIVGRVRRTLAAIGATEESDLSKSILINLTRGSVRAVVADFRGSVSEADLANASHSAIYNVAHLRDHLRRWVKERGGDVSMVDKAVAKLKRASDRAGPCQCR